MLHKAKIEGRTYTIKRCSKCEYFKVLGSFNMDTTRADGRQRYCRSCSNKYGRNNYEDNKERYYERNTKRLDMIRALPNEVTTMDYAKILESFNYSCALTGETKNIEQEHFIALSTGHAGGVLGNIVPISASLNASKHAKNPFKWFAEVRKEYDIDVRKWNSLIEYLAHTNGLSIDDYINYVNWCYDNPRTVEDVQREPRHSLQLWQQARRREIEARVEAAHLNSHALGIRL